MTDAEVIAAIRCRHLKANIWPFESNPALMGTPDWTRARVDPGGSIFGPGPYVHVPIVGDQWDGITERVYPPAALRRRLAKLWKPVLAPEAIPMTPPTQQEPEARDAGDALATMAEAYQDGVRAFARWVSKHWQMPRADFERSEPKPEGDYIDGFNAGIESIEYAPDVFFDEVI